MAHGLTPGRMSARTVAENMALEWGKLYKHDSMRNSRQVVCVDLNSGLQNCAARWCGLMATTQMWG